MSEALVLFAREGAVATLTLNRPDKLNALNVALLDALLDAIGRIAREDGLRCVILTGAGKAFAAGADIAEMLAYDVAQARAFSEKGHAIMAGLEALEVPVIAAVNGFALGGGMELALGCDFIHASERSKLGQPEVKLGVIPGFGGTTRLARRVGIARARELVYGGAMIAADEALRIGLVNAVHAPDALLPAVFELARTIAAMGPRAVAAAKRALREGEERLLTDANAIETAAFADCFLTEDQKEGMRAFLEKRSADFHGR